MSELETSGQTRAEAATPRGAAEPAMPADPERITARMRLLNASSVLFVLFLLVNLLPDVTKDDMSRTLTSPCCMSSQAGNPVGRGR